MTKAIKRSDVIRHISNLSAEECYRLCCYHPRLHIKFQQVVKDEYDDGNITWNDLCDVGDWRYLKCTP